MRVVNHQKVTVIIVSHDSLPALDDALVRLAEALRGNEFELILVDNNSIDGSVAYVKRHFPTARIIEKQVNLGFAAACNQAAWVADGDYLLFHNPDVRLDRDAIDRLLAVFQANENVGAVGGRMRFADGSFQATCRNLPTPGNLVFSRGSVLSHFYGSKTYTLGDFDQTTEVPAVAGTLMMIDRDVFVSMGGFDERFFVYMEDTDLCLRLGRAGLRNFLSPEAGAVHLWGKGSSAGRIRRRWYHHISMWKYALKHFPKAVSLIILPVVLAANFIIAVLFPGMTGGGSK